MNIFLNQCYENGETYLLIIEQQILFRCNFLKQTKDQEKNIHATSFKPNKWFTKNIIIHVSKIIMLCYSFTFKLLKWHLQLKTHLQIRSIFVYLAIWKYGNTQRKICASIIEIFDTVDSPMWTSHSCKYFIYLVQSWFCKILVCMRRYCITSNKIDLNLHVFTIISIISSI